MKIVQINTVPNGSTGTIMMNIHNELLKRGHDSYVVWGRGRKSNDNNEIYMGDKIGVYFHVLYSRITGKIGFASKRATKKLLKKLDEIKPDIIHLHNIHGYYINIDLLFNYIKNNNIRVIWTLHDCWPFTGHCTYFDLAKCNKWKKECMNCKQRSEYPKSYFDNSKWCFDKKRELFNKVEKLTIVTPSEWMASLVKKSFLKNYNVIIINNGIDTNVFKILDKDKLAFRIKYNLENKKIILGIASPWSKRKGLDDFIELSKKISDDYKIVLVGLSKKQIKKLPNNILGIERTNNIDELVDIYNSSDMFFNPTYEDNYPTTNLEAICCGLRTITYNTGGSPESATINGQVTTKKDFIKNYKNIIKTKNKTKFFCFSKEKMCSNYLKLYEN